jgi:hypothetical protein
MTSLKFKLLVALMIVATGCYVAYLEVQASDDSDEQIGNAAVWAPSDEQLAMLNRDCRNDRTDGYAQCFIAKMPDFGASEEAVAFTRDYADQNHGTLAILHGFHPMDAVDLGYVYFPGGGEVRQGWLLLNGFPSLVNVDDLERLPEAQMEKHPLWGTLRSKFPHLQISLDDAERPAGTAPEMERLPDGSQRFIVQYPLRDGCRSCSLAGHAAFSFDFDASGRLVVVRFVSITAAQSSIS